MIRMLILPLAVSGCVAATPAPAPQGAATVVTGVEPGRDRYANPADAAAYDGFVGEYASLDCRTLRSEVLARGRATDPGGGTLAADVSGTLIGGAAGSIARSVGRRAANVQADEAQLRADAGKAVLDARC